MYSASEFAGGEGKECVLRRVHKPMTQKGFPPSWCFLDGSVTEALVTLSVNPPGSVSPAAVNLCTRAELAMALEPVTSKHYFTTLYRFSQNFWKRFLLNRVNLTLAAQSGWSCRCLLGEEKSHVLSPLW